MTIFNTPKDQSKEAPSVSKTSQITPNTKTEYDHVQFIMSESMKRRPDIFSIGQSLGAINSIDILRDLQGINAKPQVLDAIESRITELSKVTKPLKRK